MNFKKSFETRKYLVILVFFFVLIVNPVTIKLFFSQDGSLSPLQVKGIITLDILVILVSALLEFTKNSKKNRLTKNHNIKEKMILVIVSIILSFFILEIAGFFLNLKIDENKIIHSANVIGNENNVNTGKRIGILPNGTLVYDVTYSLDEFGRRINPMEGNKTPLILFGGSYTFGSFLEDNQSLPYYLSIYSDYDVYSYSRGGEGPAQMLANLQREEFRDEINGNGGVAIHLFEEHQIRRVILDTQNVNSGSYLEKMPRYFINKKGDLIRNGYLSESNLVRILFYRTLSKSNIASFFGINLPTSNKKGVYLAYRIIEESRNIYESKFDGKFYVIWHPLDTRKVLKPSEKKYFIDLLQKSEIPLIEFNISRKNNIIQFDGHPNSKFNNMFAQKVNKELLKKNMFAELT
ncbi:hypothetical protein ISS07_04545 [Candidatus Woesearchaeota archaeon]|nr:hypothetical protein [Candidatus Woesearchaeota archaeon]